MASSRALALGALLVSHLLAAHALYTTEDDLLLLTADNFDKEVLETDGPAVVEFYSPGCGHCQALASEYRRLARNLQGLAIVGAVDCSDARAAKLCQLNAIQGFPTIKVYSPDKKKNPYTGGWMKDVAVYTGARTAKAISAAVTETLHTNQITSVKSLEDLEAFTSKQPPLAKVLLFTDKPQSTVLYKGLSLAYVGRLRFAEVRPEAADVVAKYKVESYPSLVLVDQDGKEEVYTGTLKAGPLRATLDRYAAAEPVAEEVSGSGPKEGEEEAKRPKGFPGLEAEVHTLTMANLSSIDGSPAMWLIGFYSSAGSPCGSQVEAATKLLKEVQEVVSLGLLDVAGGELGPLRSYGLDTAALSGDKGCELQLVLFPAGEDKQEQEAYLRWEGGLDDAKALQKWVVDEVPDRTMLLGSHPELQGFATMGMVPGSAAGDEGAAGKRIGKVILFSSKKEVPGVYKALALQMAPKASLVFGWVQPGSFAAETMKQLHITKAPGLVAVLPTPPEAMPEDQRKKQPPGQVPLSIQPYVGPLKFQSMRMWLQAMSVMAGLSRDGFEFPGMQDDSSSSSSSSSGAASVTEISSNQQLQEQCLSQGAICVLALLGGSPGESAQEEQQALVQELAKAQAGKPLRFAIMDASKQKSLREAVGLVGPAPEVLPALVALSGRRQRFSLMGGPFTQEAAQEFLGKVLSGSATTSPMQVTPTCVDGGESEGVVEAEIVEDEFDLSDIMNEEVDGAILSKEEQLKKVEEELKAAEEAARAAKASSKKKKKKTKAKKSKKATTGGSKDEL